MFCYTDSGLARNFCCYGRFYGGLPRKNIVTNKIVIGKTHFPINLLILYKTIKYFTLSVKLYTMWQITNYVTYETVILKTYYSTS
jgi:hypothetical protein